MLAGIFAAHGFFFGNCRPADDLNPKGFYENLAIYGGRKDVLNVLKEQGLKPGQNWGVKVGEGKYQQIKATSFDLILVTWRRPKEIIASRKIAKGFGKSAHNANAKEYPEPCRVINTSLLADGDFQQIRDAFTLLGVPFSEETARAWIDPAIWNRGLET